MDPRHRGTNQLLRDGAIWSRPPPTSWPSWRRCWPRGACRPAPRPTAGARARPRRQRRPPPARAAAPIGDDLADRVARALGPEPLAVDELIRECDAASPDVQAALLELELAGRIDRQPGNRVCLRAG